MVMEQKRRGRPPLNREPISREPINRQADKWEEPMDHALEDAFDAMPERSRDNGLRSNDIMRAESPRAVSAEDDSFARAAKRAAELRAHVDFEEDGTDEFYIPQGDIPPGWDYEWKVKYVMGREETSHMLALRRSGWEEVPTSRHPSYMPRGTDAEFIERRGMVLMERPAEITRQVRHKDLYNARRQVAEKEGQLEQAGMGQFERANKDQSMVKVKKSFESIPIPQE